MKRYALLTVLVACHALSAQAAEPPGLVVWVEERVPLDGFLRRMFLAELPKAPSGTAMAVLFSSESKRPAGPVVVVTLKTSPPSRYPRALGLAGSKDGRILPIIEIYLHPVAKLLPPGSPPAHLGTALGRVAAHELIHYTTQRAGHDASGIFSESLGPDALVEPSEITRE